MTEEFREIYNLWKNVEKDYDHSNSDTYRVRSALEKAENIEDVINALNATRYYINYNANLHDIYVKIATDYPETRTRIDGILFKREIAKAVQPNYYEDNNIVSEIQNTDDIDKIIDLSLSFSSAYKKAQALTVIRKKRPDKNEKIDLLLSKLLVRQYIPNYYSYDDRKDQIEEFKNIIEQCQTLDEIIDHVVNEGAAIESFCIFQTLQSIREVYPEKSDAIQAIFNNFTKIENYENLSDFYRNIFDMIKADPGHSREYIALIKEQLPSDKNDEKSLRCIYNELNNIRYSSISAACSNAAYDFNDEHPEQKSEFADLFVQTLKSDKNTSDTLNRASEILPYVILDVPDRNFELLKISHEKIDNPRAIDYALSNVKGVSEKDPEKGFDLIKQFYQLSVEIEYTLNSGGYLCTAIKNVIDSNPSKAKEFLDWAKEILDANNKANLIFYTHLLKIHEKYPELMPLPQVQDLLTQELQTKTDENSVGNMLANFKVLTEAPIADSALDMVHSAMKRVKFVETGDHCGFNPLGDTYKAVNTILQGGNASYDKGLQIVETGLKNNNHQLSGALNILKTISAQPEYVDECIRLTELIHNNSKSGCYGDWDISKSKAKFLCDIMKDYPQKKDKCLPILMEMLPISYEKPQPESDEDESADILKEDENIKPPRRRPRRPSARTEDAPDTLITKNTKENILSREEIIAQNVIHDTKTLSEIIRSILEVDPDKFIECLPAMQKVTHEEYNREGSNILAVAKQFMNTHPSECLDLFITCIDLHSYGNYDCQKYANNVLETAEELIAVKPEINQESQQKLIDAVWDAGYYAARDEGYFREVDKKLMQEKRAGIYLKMFQSKAFSEETGINIIKKIASEDKDFYIILLTEKLCTPKQVTQILLELKETKYYNEIAKLAKQNYTDNNEVKATIKAIQTERRNKKIIDEVLNESPAGKKIEALIRLADAVVKTKDDKKIYQFRDMLFCKGEKHVFDIDAKAMEWFVNNGRPEDLEALNNLSQLYGIKTELSDYYTVDPAQNAAYRIRFGGEYSEIGKIDRYVQAYDEDGNMYFEEIENPHYERMLSQGYRDFKPDYSRTYKPSEYNLHENKAFETLAKHGVKIPIKLLQAALAEYHVPIDSTEGEKRITFRDLNATELQHILVNYYYHKEGWAHRDDRDMESSENFPERLKEERKGDYLPMKTVSSKAPAAIREKLWKFYARREQLVEFISKDWTRMGISEDTVYDVWGNARAIGYPVAYTENSRGRIVRSHFGMDNNLHHGGNINLEGKTIGGPLRTGGTNKTIMDCMGQDKLDHKINSIFITNNIREAYTIIDYEGYEMQREGGKFGINSHDPFHLYDNPCVYLYLKADGKLTVKEKADNRIKKRMMVTRFPSARCAENERIVYYGGPRECSCAIMDTKGNVRQAFYDFWKENLTNDKQQTSSVATNTPVQRDGKIKMRA